MTTLYSILAFVPEQKIPETIPEGFVVYTILVLTILGLVFGIILAYAAKKFRVEENPLIEEVEEVLPRGQCGACGYAGCRSYAEAVADKPEVEPNLCTPGGNKVTKKVAEITGKAAEERLKLTVSLRCAPDRAGRSPGCGHHSRSAYLRPVTAPR